MLLHLLTNLGGTGVKLAYSIGGKQMSPNANLIISSHQITKKRGKK